MFDFVRHRLKNLALLTLSLVLLPIDTIAVLVIDLWSRFTVKRHTNDAIPNSLRKTVLVTGVSMAKGLSLARLFHRAGHRVIGADFHPLSLGRVSSSIDKFYALPSPRKHYLADEDEVDDDPYALRLLEIVRNEQVDLWVSNSDVSAAIQDALARDMIESQTTTKAIQLSARHIRLLHEKDTFIDHVRGLGLDVPDTEIVQTRAAVIDFLNKRGGLKAQSASSKRFLLKPVGVNDVARCDMPLLPLASEQETIRRIDKAPLETGSWIMQEYVQGFEFCTHALVIKGQIRAFVACPSADLLMHYKALDPDLPLSKAMLDFTQKVAAANGEDFTGHVSFDFLVKSGLGQDAKDHEVKLYPIECNPRVHTATVLFNDTPELVEEYLAVLDPGAKTTDKAIVTPTNPKKYYWIGQDLVERLLYPMWRCFPRLPQASGETRSFVNHVKSWKDGTFETWDPWPWWWLYHVYWPVQFAQYVIWGRWQKLNVSTGKAFQAN